MTEVKGRLAWCLAALVALLSAAPALAATRIDRYEAKMQLGNRSGGQIALEILFQNSRGAPNHFTPRTVTRVDFRNVPLRCANSPGDPMTELLLTSSDKDPGDEFSFVQADRAHGRKPKPRRYAFVFAGALEQPPATVSGKVDKPTKRKRGTPARARGRFTIADYDAGPGYMNCSTETRSWSAPRPVK
jgi:hypothetical protein